MAIHFYYGSGSPYAWRVWLALEHKKLPYELKVLSFSSGEMRKPEFRGLNPRGKVPVIVDEGFVLYESSAIMEYLDDAYPDNPGLFPAEVRQRALCRRYIREVDSYLAPPLEILVEEILNKPRLAWSGQGIERARVSLIREVGAFEAILHGGFLFDEVSAADFTLYPSLALALRLEARKPDLGIHTAIAPHLACWMKKVEALAYFSRTYPPHWR